MDRFPSTSWELLAEAVRREDDSVSARNEFAERYYAAVRAYIATLTRGGGDADELTQRFFEEVVLSGGLLTQADHAKGRFRPYLKQAIRNFLIDEHRQQRRAAAREVRPDSVAGGWNGIASDTSPAPDEEMLRAWARSVVGMALARLERACAEKQQREHYDMFVRRYITDPDHPPSWREVGEPFGLDEKLARSRAETAARQFRGLLRQIIASDVGAGEDIDDELRAVLELL